MPRGEIRKTVQLGLRLEEALLDKIAAAAKVNGRSANVEAVERLQASFAADDVLGGAPELAALTRLIVGAFALGGQRGARSKGHPEWTPGEWLNDPLAYGAAVAAATEAMRIAQPTTYESQHPDEEVRRQHAELHAYAARVSGLGGAVKVSKTKGGKK
jgi:hypothetical protein